MSSCKPESQKQRLERIAVQLLAGRMANEKSSEHFDGMFDASFAIRRAQELIKQLDALPLDE